MGIDELGFVWLSDFWGAGLMVLGVVGLFLWSHGWVRTGQPVRPMAIKRRRPRRARRTLAVRPAPATVRPLLVARSELPRGARARTAARSTDRPIAA